MKKNIIFGVLTFLLFSGCAPLPTAPHSQTESESGEVLQEENSAEQEKDTAPANPKIRQPDKTADEMSMPPVADSETTPTNKPKSGDPDRTNGEPKPAQENALHEETIKEDIVENPNPIETIEVTPKEAGITTAHSSKEQASPGPATKPPDSKAMPFWDEVSVQITEPTSSEYYSFTGTRIEISGTNSTNITEMAVSYPKYKDWYRLTNFKPGDKIWRYVADVRYMNLTDGENVYVVQAFTGAGENRKLAKEASITIYARVPDTVLDVPFNNKIEVDFYEKPVVTSMTELFRQVGKNEAALAYEQATARGLISEDVVREVGKVQRGTYINSTMHIVKAGCNDMGCSMNLLRFLKTPDNELVLLSKISTDLSREYKELLQSQLRYDRETEITDLFPPNEIMLPNSKYKLVRKDQILSSLFDELNKMSSSIQEANTPLYQDDQLGLSFYDNLRGCLVTPNKDGTVSEYVFNLVFQKKDQSALQDFWKPGKITIIWNDNTITGKYYIHSQMGCGGPNCYLVANEDIAQRLRAVGRTDSGEEVYEEMTANTEDLQNGELSHVRNLYQYQNGNPEDDPERFSEFMQSHPLIYIKDPFGRYIGFTEETAIPAVECGKPVIYLYPEVETDISVKVKPTGGFTKTEPEYGNGWFVRATPEGVITNHSDGKTYPYLFWEGKADDLSLQKTGFVIADEMLEAKLREILYRLGLNQNETDDFLEFWLPEIRKEKKPYYFVSFIPKEHFDIMAPLEVSPRPKTVIRVFMEFTGLSNEINVTAPNIETPERKGFTVVEWGGALH